MKTITDFMKNENECMSPDEVVQLIKLNCNLIENLVVMKIEIHNWHDEYYFDICELSELYYTLNELIQEQDCKNGCELRENDNGERYFSILGSNRYNKNTGEFVATDEVKVYFKNFHW